MKNSTRYLITGAASVALFATAFTVAMAATPNDITPDAAPIEVPASTTEQATVLAPVAVGDTAPPASGLSMEVGSESVSFTSTDTPGEEPGGEPYSGNPTPGVDILAAAAALDEAGGTTGAAGTGTGATPGTTPEPEPSDDSTPASDPCATGDEETCPEGLVATLYDTEVDPNLRISPYIDPDQEPGDALIWCEVGGVTEGALRVGAHSNEPATIYMSYWPIGNPGGVKRLEMTQREEFPDGRGTRNCGATEPLEEGMYQAIVNAMTPDGRVAEPISFEFDSRGAATIPQMKVVPLGTNWVWVGVKHRATQRALIAGYTIDEGSDLACSDYRDGMGAGGVRLVEHIGPHTEVMSAEYMARYNYQSGYSRSTSVLLYMPEGTTARLCGATFNDAEPSWDTRVADRVEMATVWSPDTWEAVTTVRNVSTYRPGTITVRGMGQTGADCGDPARIVVDGEASDTATVTDVNQEVCAISGQNTQLEVTTSYTNEDGTRGSGESHKRFLLMGLAETGPSRMPDDLTYTVFLPGLGQDACPDTTEGECEMARRTRGAVATIDVTWRNSGTGGATEWGVSSIDSADVEDERPDTPQFDETARFTAEFQRGSNWVTEAKGTVRWDRVVDWTAEAVGDCYVGGATSSTASGTSRVVSDGVTESNVFLPGLCPGTTYYTVLRYTDAEGNSGLATSPGAGGLTPTVGWWPSMFLTPQKYLRIEGSTVIDNVTPADFRSAWYLDGSSVYVDDQQFIMWFTDGILDGHCYPSTETRATSYPHFFIVPLQEEYVITQSLIGRSDQNRLPQSPNCMWRDPTWYRDRTATTVTLNQLLNGITMSGDLHQEEHPTNFRPFEYRQTLTGTIQDSPTGS